MNAKRNTLIFFDLLPDSALDEPYVLSSLQEFETAMVTIGFGRWPAATMLLFSAIEKLLKSSLGGGDEKSHVLIGDFASRNEEISADLEDRVQKYRKLRNDIAHGGYSPDIDSRCVRLFFNAGIPFFDCILKFKFNGDKESLSGSHASWFWNIYEITGQAFSKSKEDNPEWIGKLQLFSLASRKISIIGHSSQAVSSVRHQEWFLLENESFLNLFEYDWQRWFYRTASRKVTAKGASLASLEDFADLECPICGGGDGCLGYSECEENPGTEIWNFGGFTGFCCYSLTCEGGGVLVSDRDLLKLLFEDRATEEEINNLLRSDFKSSAEVRLG